MKDFKIILILGLLLTFNIAFGQQPDNEQVAIGRKVIILISEGKTQEVWQLFDKKNVPNFSEEQLSTGLGQISAILSTATSYDLSMSRVKIIDSKKINFYRFKGLSKSSDTNADVYVDVLFFENSNLVAGVSPKRLVSVQNIPLNSSKAFTTAGQETPVEDVSTILIDNITYKVRGINIVHIEKDKGLLAIQVETKMPENGNAEEKEFKQAAVKFAKYVVENHYVEKAKSKAKEINKSY
ncbi:hypothetical protein HMJ29_00625 [Hymenobacter taeanensis]|uniref:Uncharacterized protein n=1 Tax=Hymenobacter taeanensis TaxID=2735321 RepID=A0A6M6BC52_9BACT|nr:MULTISPECIES: hypothetical protein [Hymenobacter]QJX45520.1 hypothetical protein HMJ29_00625 [Hymenobacter taeanensis]UOQ81232.1 hypothetical protein MUN83_00055 [Hymenobacter sp. 5414T-23]